MHDFGRMPRVLEVQGYSSYGGSEVHTFYLLQGFHRKRFEMALACPRGDGPLEGRAREIGVPVFNVDLKGRFDWESIRRLVHLMKEFKPDIVHTHCRNADFLAGIAARLAKAPALIVTVHGFLFDEHGREDLSVSGRIYRWFLKHVPDHLIAVSNAVRSHLVEACGIQPSKITTILNASSECTIRTQDELLKTRIELGLSPTDRVVVTVGQLSESKGHRILIEAIPLIMHEVPNLKVLIVGKGRLESSLRHQATCLGVSSRCLFLGIRNDVDLIIQLADLCVMPSLWEGFGRVITEAMSAGIPVVASRVGGIPEIIEHGENGLLCTPADPRALAHAIIQVLKDSNLAAKLARGGKNSVKTRLSLPRHLEKTAELFGKVLMQKRKKSLDG